MDTSGFKLMSFGDWLKEQETKRPNTNTKAGMNRYPHFIVNLPSNMTVSTKVV